MSRIGNTPITVPSGVEINLSGADLMVKGPKGTLSHVIPETISVSVDDATVVIERADDERQSKALHGLTRSLVNNMVVGVSEGFRKDLEIIGVGYRANAKGPSSLELALGFSHSISVQAPEGVTFDVPEPTKIGVIGIDKQIVGQVAAEIRAHRKPEPYKGKGVRYVGERVVRGQGRQVSNAYQNPSVRPHDRGANAGSAQGGRYRAAASPGRVRGAPSAADVSRGVYCYVGTPSV